MRCLFAAAILALVPLPSLGQTVDVAEIEPRKRGFFSWVSDLFAAKQESQSAGSTALIDAQQILRRDNQREEAKEKAYWETIRKMDAKTIGDRTRAESAARLSAARDRGQILSAYEDARRGGKITAGEAVAPQELAPNALPNGPEKNPEPLVPPRLGTNAASPVITAVTVAGDKLKQAAESIAGAVEEAFTDSPSRGAPKLSSIILALVAIFLVPSAAVMLIVLAVFSLRGGHRLQAGVLGTMGCILGLIVASATQPSADNSALLSQLRTECERDLVRLRGYVDEVTDDGVVIDDVTGAQTDEHGSAVVITDKRPARSGQEWKSPGYPVGERKALNALGMMRPMPAYADNLETAVALLAEAERARTEWWWHRAFRSLQQNLGSDPQRLITLK